MKSELMEKRKRGTRLFPLQHYVMGNNGENLFVPYHWHSEIEVLYIKTGNVHLLLEGENFDLEPENIYFINRELLHQLSSDDRNLVYYAYVFPMEYLDFRINDYAQSALIEPLHQHIIFPFRISPELNCYQQIKNEILELFELNELKSEGFHLHSKACLYKIISHFHKYHLFCEMSDITSGKRSAKTAEIKKLLSYLQIEYKNPISLGEAARLLNYSSVYFCTYFKSVFGISFINYLNHFRIEKACVLLLTTDMPVINVGLEVGFTNFSYFIRIFKRLMDVTPKQYRNSQLSTDNTPLQ